MTDTRILMVDDELDMCYLFASLLSLAGYEVVCTGNAGDALDLLLNDRFDLLITDLTLPDMSGIELLQRVRGIKNGFPVIVFTGRDSLDSATMAAGLQVSNYFKKGTTSGSELVEAIERALDNPVPE